MEFEFNRQGKLAQFYQWSHGKYEYELPQSICPYAWKLAFALLAFPITWLSYPMDASHFDIRRLILIKRILLGILGYLVLGVAGILGVKLLQNIDQTLFGLFLILGIIVAAFVIFVIGIIIALIHGLLTQSETYVETKSIVSERWNGFKDSYCPKINWKDKN